MIIHALRYRYEMFWHSFAKRLPRILIYYATIRLFATATVDEYGDTNPQDLTVTEALRRWNSSS